MLTYTLNQGGTADRVALQSNVIYSSLTEIILSGAFLFKVLWQNAGGLFYLEVHTYGNFTES